MAIERTGKVVLKRVSPGSKSERDAVCLVASDGEYVLRRRGGNAFQDDVLEKLVGSTIHATGDIAGSVLILAEWKKIDGG